MVNLTGPNSAGEAEVCVAASPLDHEVMAVAGHGGIGGITVWYTTDGWRTWEKTPIDQTIDGYSHSRGDPSCAFAPDGSLYVAYLLLDGRTCGTDFSGRYIACLRRDGPQSDYVSMGAMYEGCNCDKPFVAAGPRAGGGSEYSVYVAFDVASTQVLVAASEGDHREFTPARAVGGGGSFAVPVVNSGGDLFVVWHEDPDSPAAGAIRVARSTTGGAGFQPSVVIGYPEVKRKQSIPAAPGRGMHAGPSIAVGPDDELYVAYTTASQILNWEDADVVFSRSEDPTGRTWSRPRVVHRSSPMTQFLPWIAVDRSSGALAVFYLDAREGDNQAVEPWVSVSTDGGTSWRERKFASMPTDESCKGCQDPPRCTRSFTNYLEYNGVVISEGIITGVWAGNPDTTGCVVPGLSPSESDLDLLLHTMAIDTLYVPRARRVPTEYGSMAQAMDAASAGDTILVSGSQGPLNGSFDMSSNILILAEPGTGRPVLTAAGLDHVARVPTRCTATLRGFDFENYAGAGVDVRVADTSTPTIVEISDCRFFGGLHGVTAADASVEIRDCEFVGQTAEAILSCSVAGSIHGERRLDLDSLLVRNAEQGVRAVRNPLRVSRSTFSDLGSVGVSGIGSLSDSLIVTDTNISLGPRGVAGIEARSADTAHILPCRVDRSVCAGGDRGMDLVGTDLSSHECRISDQTEWGIASSRSRLDLDHCRMEAELGGGIRLDSSLMDLSNSQVILGGSSVGVCIEMNQCKRFGSSMVSRLWGSTLRGGEIGISVARSYILVDSVIVDSQKRYGIVATFMDTEDTLHTVIRRSTIHAGAPDAVCGIWVSAAESDSVTAAITGNSIDGWSTGILLVALKGNILPSPASAGMGPAADIQLFHPILVGNMVSLRHGQGTERVGINAAKATPAVFECNNAYLVGGGVPYVPARSGGSSNFSYSPQYCGPEKGDFSLWITSPGVPGNLCDEGIGAWDAACASDTLAFEWGGGHDTLTVSSGKKLHVLSDVIVPRGSALLLQEGVELRFDAVDDSAKGTDPMKNEVTVRGKLLAHGRDGEVVGFRSGDELPAEADWTGIRVEPGGSVEIDHCEVQHAECGMVYRSDLPGRVSNTLFAGNRDRDVLIEADADSCRLTLDHNLLLVGGGTAVEMMGQVDGVMLSGNTLLGDGRSLVGIELGALTDQESPVLIDNSIEGFRAGTGIRNSAACNPWITGNRIADSAIGIEVRQGRPLIGNPEAPAAANIISGNICGLLVTGADARPKVRFSALRGNVCGVRVQGGATPDLGSSVLDPGNNAIEPLEPGQVCVANENSNGEPPVRADGNYFGACVDCRPPRCWDGNVVVSYWLCEDPTSGPELPPDDRNQRACGISIVGTFPNPSHQGARVVFVLEGGEAKIRVEVFDLCGRRVRLMEGVEFGPGQHELDWDGRDAAGNIVPSGLYFLRFRADGDMDRSARVTVVR